MTGVEFRLMALTLTYLHRLPDECGHLRSKQMLKLGAYDTILKKQTKA